MGYLKRMLPMLLALQLLDRAPDKHAAELFSGERAVSKNLGSLGYLVQSFDARYNANHDLLKPAGFYVALATWPRDSSRAIVLKQASIRSCKSCKVLLCTVCSCFEVCRLPFGLYRVALKACEG
jgi:hypothetical protein